MHLIYILKNGESDGSSLFSDAFIFAESILSNPLSYLFTAVVRHGYDAKHLRDCILQLIPKPWKDPTCSDNYRTIALAPTFYILIYETLSTPRLFKLLAAIGSILLELLGIYVDDIVLSAPSACHLGHILCSDLCDTDDFLRV